MTDWIEWRGGDCPVKSDKTLGAVIFRGGQHAYGAYLRNLEWGEFGWVTIVAYRITEDHEPADYAAEIADLKKKVSELTSDKIMLRSELMALKGQQEPIVTVSDQAVWARVFSDKSVAIYSMDVTGYCVPGVMKSTFHDDRIVKIEWVPK